MRPPASTTAIVCAAARLRDIRRTRRPQRLADRADRAEIGAGPDDDLGSHCPQVLHGGREMANRVLGLDPMGHVIGPDHDHGDIGWLGQPSDLLPEFGRFRAHDGDIRDPHGLMGDS